MVPLFLPCKGNKTVSEENQTRLLSSATIKSKYFFIKKIIIKEQENLDNKKHRCVGSLCLNQNINKILR
jgi:hypothetical protein